MATLETSTPTEPAIAIFPWGEVIEEFLDPLGLRLEDFTARMTGGWLFGYIAALRSQGWRPIIVCASEAVDRVTRLEHAETGAPVWVAPAKRAGVDARQHPSLRCVQQWLKSPQRDFAGILDAERCATILVQEYEYFRFDLLTVLARRTQRALFATFQGGDVTLSALERLVRPWSLRRCDGLIVASARERDRLSQSYPRARMPIANIPNPLDTDVWQPDDKNRARVELGLPEQAFIVIQHGRTDIARKGLDILVEAWTRFSAKHADAQAIIIGSGQDHAAFAQLLARERPERLAWVQSYVTDRPLMRRWLSAADAYLITSRTEGMPVAPLEAMACGLPVISSDAHGLPDIFAAGEAHGGVVTAREDVNGIVAALDRLAADLSLRSRLSHAARQRVTDGFSIAAVGEALANFMQNPRPRERSRDRRLSPIPPAIRTSHRERAVHK